MIKSKFILVLAILASGFFSGLESMCPKKCHLALGSYYIADAASIGLDLNLNFIASLFQMTSDEVLPYNPAIHNKDQISSRTRMNVNFSCDCIENSFLGHTFQYTMQSNDTYNTVAKYYANLTNTYSLQKFNSYPANNVPSGATVNVTVNCSCGNRSVSDQYGLFETYPLQSGENLSSVATAYNIPEELVEEYNPGVSFSSMGAILYVPARDVNGSFRALSSKRNLSGGAITGTLIGAIAILVSTGLVFYCLVDKRRKAEKASELPLVSGESPLPLVVKSVEFSYEELSKATNDFSMANKIGQGGFGSVYYAVLRGEEAAIKKMETQASQEFLAELKVLTHVHHSNLVRLIGYCIEGALFLVYEYIENGNLSQHLCSSGRWSPLSWANRVQIALDSARGLEYIHEHTVPVYIHRDIKSANILIDKNNCAKVADFGLAKLAEVGSTSFFTGPVGTIGYMSPEYWSYGRVSSKVDIYAFGVVLYELISAKGAILIIEPSSDASSEAMAKGLVGLFDDALMDGDPKESLKKLVDPRLGSDFPIDSIMKMAQLAKACTHYEPRKRPGMRTVVVALMAVADLISG
ncbi:chitin elicitor receptor kinase 1-like [Carex rostrata]